MVMAAVFSTREQFVGSHQRLPSFTAASQSRGDKRNSLTPARITAASHASNLRVSDCLRQNASHRPPVSCSHNAPDNRNCHFRDQMGILTHVLNFCRRWGTNPVPEPGITSFPSPGSPAAPALSHLAAPGSRWSDGRIAEGGTRNRRRPLRHPVVVLRFLSDPHGAVRHPERRDSGRCLFVWKIPVMNHPNLLFGSFRIQIPDLLHWLIRSSPHLRGLFFLRRLLLWLF